MSDEEVAAYAQEVIVSSDKSNTVASANDPYTQRLNRIAGSFNNKDGINIKVYKTNEVNAFACADGSIRVYSGLMDIMSDSEVLGVIGHEIGHIRNKDTKNAFKKALMNSAILDGIASTSNTAAALSQSQLGQLGESFLSSQFSQKQEYAADEYGYNFLKSYNVNPWAMAMSFEKLSQLQGGSSAKSSAMQQLFSTHPDIEARTEKMKSRATAEGFKRPAK